MAKTINSMGSYKPRNPQPKDTTTKAEAMREYRQVLKKIELCTEYGDYWNALWDRKRQLKALLNTHNN